MLVETIDRMAKYILNTLQRWRKRLFAGENEFLVRKSDLFIWESAREQGVIAMDR